MHHDTMPSEAASHRGVSSYVFDEYGLICEYEEWFDTAVYAVAMKAPS
jgi:hypothetical protein